MIILSTVYRCGTSSNEVLVTHSFPLKNQSFICPIWKFVFKNVFANLTRIQTKIQTKIHLNDLQQTKVAEPNCSSFNIYCSSIHFCSFCYKSYYSTVFNIETKNCLLIKRRAVLKRKVTERHTPLDKRLDLILRKVTNPDLQTFITSRLVSFDVSIS